MKGVFARFKKQARVEPVKYKDICASAQRCLNNKEGELLIDHLVDFFGLDEPSGCMSSGEANYRNGTQDVVKYILGLVTDKE